MSGAGQELQAQALCSRLGSRLLSKPRPGAPQLALTHATEGTASLPAARARRDRALVPDTHTVVKAIKDPNPF